MQKKTEVAEFEIGDLLPIGMTLVVLGITISYGLQVMSDVSGDMDANSVEQNATNSGITAVAIIPTKLSTIVTVVVAAILIGILVRYLYRQFA